MNGSHRKRTLTLLLVFLWTITVSACGPNADNAEAESLLTEAKSGESKTLEMRSPEKTTEFACGTLRCNLAKEYCFRAFPGAVQPGSAGFTESCRAKPAPNCTEIERSGKCTGNERTGLTVEVYFP